MKIHNIKISNLLSFPYVANMKNEAGVTFPVGVTDVHTHILIGPNGSGKSNFLNIVNYLFRVWMTDRYTLNDQYVSRNDTANLDRTIVQIPHPIISLAPHVEYTDKPSEIITSFYLSDLDRDNALFIVKYAQKINELLGSYSRIPVRFDTNVSEEEIKTRMSLHVKCSINTKTGVVATSCLDNDSVGQLFFAYMKHFAAIQHLITIYNTFIVSDPKERVRHLNNTFAIIGCYRRLSHLDVHYDLQFRYGSDVLQTIDEDKDFFSQANMPIGFEMLKKKLAKAYHYSCPSWDKPCKEALQHNKEYVAINALLKEYIGVSLRLYRPEHEETRYTFFLENDAGHRYEFDELSSGDKAILFLITTMYGFDLENGLIVIDEPELHLHPQLQKKLLSLLERVGNALKIQCIVATHAALLINENNIQYVHRFYMRDHATQVVAPLHSYHEHESNLVQILRFTNTAKIFFVNKIIMVEGEIDELFFGYYLNYISEHYPERAKKVNNYAIVNINGKWSFKRRKRFLDKFGLESYFIGDWDNIQDTGVKIDMKAYRKHLEGLPKTRKYPTVIQLLKEESPEKWNEIVQLIDQLYDEDIFLLKQGDTETYMGIWQKWVEETIDFYHKQFPTWLKDPKFESKRAEMEQIFSRIFR